MLTIKFSKREKAERGQEAKVKLRKILKLRTSKDLPKIKVLIAQTSRDNMTWYARVFADSKDGVQDITFYTALALGWPLVEVNNSRAVKGGGFGTSREFEIAHNLSYALHGMRMEHAPKKLRDLYLTSDATYDRDRKRYDRVSDRLRAALDRALERGDEARALVLQQRKNLVYHRFYPRQYHGPRPGYTIKAEWL